MILITRSDDAITAWSVMTAAFNKINGRVWVLCQKFLIDTKKFRIESLPTKRTSHCTIARVLCKFAPVLLTDIFYHSEEHKLVRS